MFEFLEAHYWTILIIVNYILAITAMITVLLNNINPSKTLSYLIVLALFPFLGLLVYYLFGQEYRKKKIFSRKHIANSKVIRSVEPAYKIKRFDQLSLKNELDDKVKLIKLINNSEQSPLTLHNDIKILINGEEKFDYLLRDINNASEHIHIEYYILKDDNIGTQILNAICTKAKQGVVVKLSYDDVGSTISTAMKRKLDQSGVIHEPFMPVLFSSLAGKSNYRNHRKLVIIDGLIGYIGGINISDYYVNTKNSSLFWRDTHLRIVGDAVKVLQFHFLTTWDFVTEDDLEVKTEYFPEIKTSGEVPIQIAASGPDTDWASIMEAILTAINNAEKYIYITTPYFIPNDQIITALQIAARVDIDVRLLVPKESDSWIAKYATNSYLESLLNAGVKVYRYSKGFIHAKTIVVDDVFCTVGTCNLDNRSFSINFEINALIYHTATSKEIKSQFLNDLNDSELIDYQSWKNRKPMFRFYESFSRLWSPLL